MHGANIKITSSCVQSHQIGEVTSLSLFLLSVRLYTSVFVVTNNNKSGIILYSYQPVISMLLYTLARSFAIQIITESHFINTSTPMNRMQLSWYSDQAKNWTADEQWFDSLVGRDSNLLQKSKSDLGFTQPRINLLASEFIFF